MKISKLLSLPLVFIFVSLSSLSAADEPVVTATFNLVSVNVSAKDVYIRQGTNLVQLVLNEGIFDPAQIAYSGPISLQLLRKKQDPEGKEFYEPTGEVRFPSAGAGSYLLIFASAGRGQIHAAVVPQPSIKNQPGTLRIVNLTRTATAVLVNKNKQLLQPGAVGEFAPVAEERRLILRVGIEREDRWIESTNTFYRTDLSVRRTTLLMDSGPSKPNASAPNVSLFSFIERVPTEPQRVASATSASAR